MPLNNQGRLGVIISVNFVEVKHPILHAKYHDSTAFSAREEDFKRHIPYMGLAAILFM